MAFEYNGVPIEITIYPAGEYGWDVVVTDKDGNDEGDCEFFETKAEAIKEGRKRFNAEPTVKTLIALNKEYGFEDDKHRIVLANDKRVIKTR